MSTVKNSNGKFTLTAYGGDAKTLLAFNLDPSSTRGLAGFSIACAPAGQPAYYIHNQLQLEHPTKHARAPHEPANSTVNAPIQKFRWVHVPGSVHQGLQPFMGSYTYTVTPRYFNDQGSLQPLDASLGVSVVIPVTPFSKGGLSLGFTRGYVQSQAFVNHFGKQALIRPDSSDLLFDTSQLSGTNSRGARYTFADEYRWLGYTARQRIFALLDEVLQDESLRLDVFAYDLNEPDFIQALLQLAGQGRARVILDNAALHHDKLGSQPEDQFAQLFTARQTGAAAILRGKFARFAHDKVLIVYNGQGPLKVLTGSTNFSVTGLYVNSNHVIGFDQPEVAAMYARVFEESWSDRVRAPAFRATDLSAGPFASTSAAVPPSSITFSPHTATVANQVLKELAGRIQAEGAKTSGGSVLFAVMQIDAGTSPVFQALNDLHQVQSILSYGVSDGPRAIYLYKPGTRSGILVSGKPGPTSLPAPFDQVPSVGAGHQIHHKFVVCGFNQPDAVVYCGSSNLAVGGETDNGDNLLAIHDGDVATAFAIEALSLVDHFQFLNKYATGGKGSTDGSRKAPAAKPASTPVQAAVAAHWYLTADDHWVRPYFDPNDLKYTDRLLFGQ